MVIVLKQGTTTEQKGEIRELLESRGFRIKEIVGEERTAPLRTSFEEHSRVELVLVEAVVLDRRGRHVRGVPRSSFRLTEGGRDVEIVTLAGQTRPLHQGWPVRENLVVQVWCAVYAILAARPARCERKRDRRSVG